MIGFVRALIALFHPERTCPSCPHRADDPANI